MESRTHSDSIRRLATWMPVLVAGFFVVAALAPAMAGAAGFNVSPDDPPDCVWIRDFSPMQQITITIDDPGTVPTDDYVIVRTTDGWGNYNFDSEPRPDFSAGWHITVDDGVVSITHTVLNVGIAGFDVAEDGCWGWSQFSNSTVNVGFWCDDLGSYIDRLVPTDFGGNWSADFTDPVPDGLGQNQGADLKITDTATVTQGDGGGGATQTNGRPANPMVVVYPNEDRVDGWQWEPFAQVTVNIDEGGAGGGFEYTMNTQADGGGNLRVQTNGEFDIQPGDVVSATDGTLDTETTVTQLQITGVDTGSDMISGTAEAGSWVWINVHTGTDLEVQADGDGNWSVSAGFDMMPGADLQAYQKDDDWDRTQINYHVPNPRFEANVTRNGVFGWEWTPGNGVFVMIDSVLAGTATVGEDGNFDCMMDTGFTLAPGQIVEVGDGVHDKSLTVSSIAVGEVDEFADTVSGTGVAGSWLWVEVWFANDARRHVQVSGEGEWTADFRNTTEDWEQVYDVVLGSRGGTAQHDDDGDSTLVQWSLPNPRFGVDSGTGDIWGSDFAPSAQVTVTVDIPGEGEEPDRTWTVPTDYYGNFDFGVGGEFDLAVGHIVTVTDGEVTKDHTVMELTVDAVDTDLELVSGHTPEAAAIVEVDAYGMAYRRVEANGSGDWDADFLNEAAEGGGWGTADLGPGTQGEARRDDDDGDCTRATWRVPNTSIGVDPDREEIWGGDFTPLVDVTITVDDGGDGYGWVAKTDEWGNFGIGFAGEFDLQVGHTVTVTDGPTTREHTVLYVRVGEIDQDNETVSGETDEDVWLWVHVNNQASRRVQAGDGGAWIADFLHEAAENEGWGTADIGLGSEGEAQRHDEDNDYTVSRWRISNPCFGVNPEDEAIWGGDFAPQATVTISVDDGGDGYEWVTQSDEWGNFGIGFAGEFDLQAGHTVYVDDGTTVKDHTVLFVTVTDVDIENETVSGEADGDSALWVNENNTGAGRSVQANPEGDWTADFNVASDGEWAVDLGPGSEGDAFRHDEDGDHSVAHWRVANPCIGVDPDREEIWGGDFASSADVTITVDGAGGYREWVTQTDDWGNFGIGLSGDYDVQAGDLVTATDGVITRDHTVFYLEITGVDVENDTVHGRADNGAGVTVDAYGMAWRNVEANEEGDWSADMWNPGDGDGQADIGLGTEGEARRHEEDGDCTRVTWRVPNPCIGVAPDEESIWGGDFAPSATVTITVDHADGQEQWVTQTDEWGNFGIWFGDEFDLEVDDVVTVTDGQTIKEHTVLFVSITEVDTENDLVRGLTDPDSDLWAHVYDQASHRVIADNDGSWTADFRYEPAEGEGWGTADIGPGTEGEAQRHDGDGDHTVARWRVPNTCIGVAPDEESIWGGDFASSATVTITVDGAEGYREWVTQTDEWGNFGIWFAGEYDLQVGDLVTATDGASTREHTVLYVSIGEVDADNETVSGDTEPDEWLWVHVYDQASRWLQAGGEGDWTADFRYEPAEGEGWGTADIGLGSAGEAQRHDEDGDHTVARWRIPDPCIGVEPWREEIWGGDFAPSADVTITVDHADGQEQWVTQTDEWGNFGIGFMGEFDLEVGDIVTATDGTTTKDHTVFYLEIGGVDPDLETVTGTATPDAWLWVDVDGQASRYVQAGGDGAWFADFKVEPDEGMGWGTADIGLGTEGYARQHDEDGDHTVARWRVADPRFSVRLEDNNIGGWDWPAGDQAHITIDDPSIPGGPEVDEYVEIGFWGDFEWWIDPAEFDILPGQTVTVSCGDIVKTHVVADLSVTALDPDTDTMTGTADADAEVRTHSWRYEDEWSTTAGGDGSWTMTDMPLDKGDDGNVEQWDEDGDSTEVYWHVANPSFSVDLAFKNMEGWDWPASVEMTIEIDDPGTGLGPDQTFETTSDEGGNFYFDNEGAGVDLAPGYTVSVDDGVTFKTLVIEDVAVTAVDHETDVASGTYVPDGNLQVFAGNWSGGQQRDVQCDGEGTWTVDFNESWMWEGPFDLNPGSNVQAWVGDEDGDQTRWTWHIPNPRFRVSPVYEDVGGEEWPADTPLLITYDDPATGLSPDVTTSTVTGPMGDFWLDLGAEGANVKEGDVITVVGGTTLKEHVVLPVRVSGVNPENDTVWGTSTPDSMVWVSVDDENYWGGQQVPTDGDGDWIADFSIPGMWSYDIVEGTTGNVNQSDPDNDETWIIWQAIAPRFTVEPDTYTIRGEGWTMASHVMVRVDDPNTLLSPDWWDNEVPVGPWLGEFSTQTLPFQLMPGYVVTVSDPYELTVKTHTITALSVTGANIDTEVVYGATNSLDGIRIGYFPGGWIGPAPVAVQPDYTWSYDFTLNDPPLDLRLGDEAAVEQVDVDGDSTWVDWWILIPDPHDDAETAQENTLLDIEAPGLLGNDIYNPGETRIETITSPAHGALTVDALTGAWTYDPDTNWFGEDSFKYILTQGAYESDPATVTITVEGENTAPTAVDDAYETEYETLLEVPAPGVLGNDIDPDSDLTVTEWADASHGDVLLWADGHFSYDPDTGFSGTDTFWYRVSDGSNSDTATVTITVRPFNSPPSAVNDTYSTAEDTALVVAAPGVLSNDTDAESNPLTAIKLTNPAHGTVTFNANGSFTYTPTANYNGPDSFTYKANDGKLDSTAATVNITVTPVNDAPVAVADSASIDQDSALIVAAPGVLSNDTDVDGDALTASLVTGVSHGTLVLSANGGYTYTPDAGWSGTDSFTYRAYDGSAYSAPVTVTITVASTGLTEIPIAGADRFDTAVAVSQQAFPDGADWIVIATGRNWPDALGGSALAGALEGPILLTDTTAMSDGVLTEIGRLGASKAIILGGQAAVAASVETQLKTVLGSANVERIAGENRYLTADKVGARTIKELGGAYDGTAFVATGANYPDALAAAPLSAGLHWPLFLTRPAGISPETATAMTGVSKVLVLGGTAVVPPAIETGLNAKYGDANITRLAGTDRYATAVAVASHGVASGLTWNRLAIATGQAFPDALAGGVLQGRDGSVMLLTKSETLDPSVSAVLTANKASITEVRYLGGLNAIKQTVRDAVVAILE